MRAKMFNNIEKHAEQIYVINGVVRWKSSKRVPFNDMLEQLYKNGKILKKEIAKSNLVREKEQSTFLESYCKNYKGPSDEERFEARAAFGSGVELVNVITGDKWTT
jgi:hypothetical protein